MKPKANQGMSMAEERRRLNAALKRKGLSTPDYRAKQFKTRRKKS